MSERPARAAHGYGELSGASLPQSIRYVSHGLLTRQRDGAPPERADPPSQDRSWRAPSLDTMWDEPEPLLPSALSARRPLRAHSLANPDVWEPPPPSPLRTHHGSSRNTPPPPDSAPNTTPRHSSPHIFVNASHGTRADPGTSAAPATRVTSPQRRVAAAPRMFSMPTSQLLERRRGSNGLAQLTDPVWAPTVSSDAPSVAHPEPSPRHDAVLASPMGAAFSDKHAVRARTASLTNVPGWNDPLPALRLSQMRLDDSAPVSPGTTPSATSRWESASHAPGASTPTTPTTRQRIVSSPHSIQALSRPPPPSLSRRMTQVVPSGTSPPKREAAAQTSPPVSPLPEAPASMVTSTSPAPPPVAIPVAPPGAAPAEQVPPYWTYGPMPPPPLAPPMGMMIPLPMPVRAFVIKSFTNVDVERSLRHGVWTSTEKGNHRLDRAWAASHESGPIYLFFSVNGSGRFCGVAQMTSGLDYSQSSDIWADGHRWKGLFHVQWLIVKDVPNARLRHIVLYSGYQRH